MQIHKDNLRDCDRVVNTTEMILRAVRHGTRQGAEITIAEIQNILHRVGLFDEHYVAKGFPDTARTIRKLEDWGLLSARGGRINDATAYNYKLIALTEAGHTALTDLDTMKEQL